jgi:hypothetical protein
MINTLISGITGPELISGLFGGQDGGCLTLASLRARLAALGVVEWFYPGDVASMATTYMGVTTPVVGGVDTVGRMYGQSGRYALGANLLSNSGFDSGTTGWAIYFISGITPSATMSVINGQLAVTIASGTAGSAYQTVSASAGRFYFCGSSLSSATATAVRELFIGSSYPDFTTPTNVVRSAATSLTFYCRSVGAVGGVSYHDDAFLRLINGYHSETAVDSKRPRLFLSGTVKYLYHTTGQGLTAYLPASIGATCTVVYVPPGGTPVVVTGVAVSSQAVTLAYDHCVLAILPSTATTEQIAAVSSILALLAYRSAA